MVDLLVSLWDSKLVCSKRKPSTPGMIVWRILGLTSLLVLLLSWIGNFYDAMIVRGFLLVHLLSMLTPKTKYVAYPWPPCPKGY